jgi:hypothetical protein
MTPPFEAEHLLGYCHVWHIVCAGVFGCYDSDFEGKGHLGTTKWAMTSSQCYKLTSWYGLIQTTIIIPMMLSYMYVSIGVPMIYHHTILDMLGDILS